jgi:DNA-binding NtrC family response regulator
VITENPTTTANEQVNKSERVRAEIMAPESRPSLRSLRANAECLAIREALQQTGWNRKRAAQLLRISYRGLLYKIRQHSIVPQSDDVDVSLLVRKS